MHAHTVYMALSPPPPSYNDMHCVCVWHSPCRLVQIELSQLGLSTQYERLPIKEALEEDVWEGVKNKVSVCVVCCVCVWGGVATLVADGGGRWMDP